LAIAELAIFSAASPLPSSEISITTCPAWCDALSVTVPSAGLPGQRPFG
jgi:hypothetical protein